MPGHQPPEMRAAQLKEDLPALSELGEAPAAAILARLAFEVVYETCGMDGRVRVERVEPGEVVFLATWTPRR